MRSRVALLLCSTPVDYSGEQVLPVLQAMCA